MGTAETAVTPTKTASTKISAASTAVGARPPCRSKSYKNGDG
jgi:hypothetical protein